MSKKAFEEKLAALETLNSPDALRKALADRNNYYVSKAAELTGRFAFRELIPDLVAAFDRFFANAAKSDPQCWAKNAIVNALKDFAYDDVSLYVRGMQHIQMEAAWGPPIDSASTLRGTCALALVNCSIPRAEAMRHFVDMLAADKEKPARIDAARAIAQLGGVEAVLLLRLKALAGDLEPAVIGQCLTGLLELSAADYTSFVARFLNQDDDSRFEAAASLGEFPDPAAIAALTDCFVKSKDAELRRAILLSLGASRLESAAEFLINTVREGRIEDAETSIRALAASRFRDDMRDRVRSLIGERDEPKLNAAFAKEFAA
jgi:HEAT repeat protein